MRRRLILSLFVLATAPVITLHGSTSLVSCISTPALALTASPTTPILFPPPGSTVPANTEIRTNAAHARARLVANAGDKTDVALKDRALPDGTLAARPDVTPKPGSKLTISLASRGETPVAGMGVLGTLTWTDRVDATPPVLSIMGAPERIVAVVGPSGERIAGRPDTLRVKVRIQDDSPTAILLQFGRATQASFDAGAIADRGVLVIPTPLPDGTAIVEVPAAPTEDGTRLAMLAVDAAGQTSPWMLSEPIRNVSGDAGPSASTAASSSEPAPRRGCGCAK